MMKFNEAVRRFLIDIHAEWKMGLEYHQRRYRWNRFKYLQSKRLPAGSMTYDSAREALRTAVWKPGCYFKDDQ